MIGELTNHLWQSTLFALAAGLLAVAFRKNRADIRYWIWFSASFKFLIPLMPLLSLGSQFRRLAAVKLEAMSTVSSALGQVTQPFSQLAVSRPHSIATKDWISVAICAVWLCGFVAIVMMRLKDWTRLRAAVRSSVPLCIHAAIEVRSSPVLLEPGIVGWLRPFLLLPEGITDRLSPPQLDAVLVHELCHIRRRDNLTSVIHMIVEAIFWFHPLVWWIGARLLEERERACDEAVLRNGNEPHEYAKGILNVCKSYLESPLSCVSGITGSDLKKRIQMILAGGLPGDLNFAKKVVLACSGLAAVVIPVAAGMMQSSIIAGEVSVAHNSRFEVASIKPDKSGAESIGMFPSPGRLRIENYTLRQLIEDTYALKRYQVVGGPGWIDSDRYEIVAKAEHKVGFGDMLPMLQALLADRFQLKMHTETKEHAAYLLEIAKGGPKMRFSGEKEDHDTRLRITDNELTRKKVSMHWFSDALSGQLNLPVLDRTHLEGAYDFSLRYVPDESSTSVVGGTAVDPYDYSNASIFTAIREQLGLQLKKSKDQVTIFVIDHAEKPSEN